jgi:hypothetical protein
MRDSRRGKPLVPPTALCLGDFHLLRFVSPARSIITSPYSSVSFSSSGVEEAEGGGSGGVEEAGGGRSGGVEEVGRCGSGG